MFDMENYNYYGDSRVLAGMRTPQITDIDEQAMTGMFVHENDAGEEISHRVNLCYEVCPTCEGRGKVVNPSIDCGGLSQDDFDDDPDFRESYFSGSYDIQCPQCGGKRVVPVLNRRANDADVIAMIDAAEKDDADFVRECAAERRMGA